MRFPFRRFGEELYYYSSQLVVFFIVTIFLTSGSLAMGITSSIIVVAFMLIQTLLLASQGHKPVLRFLFSLITPLGYSILRAVTSTLDFTETTNVLLWSAAIYIGVFQALSLSLKNGTVKRLAEAALSLGSAAIFFAFYYYLDRRIGLRQAYEGGSLTRDAYLEALKIEHFAQGFNDFVSSPQHLFALLGIVSFDIMLLAARMRTINLRSRLESLLERPPRPELPAGEETPRQERHDAPPERRFTTAVSSDIVGFTTLSEMLGARRTAEFLNAYYAMWTHAAGAQGGRIITMNGDSVIMLFGLVDERQTPERALYAAYAFMDQLDGMRNDLTSQAFPFDLKVTIGVHTGTVVAAVVGPPGERRKSLFGDTIAVAARLDSMCRELHQGILVSHSTFRRLSLESQATLERIGEILLKQSTRPMPVYTRK